jgi:hypothetical protein
MCVELMLRQYPERQWTTKGQMRLSPDLFRRLDDPIKFPPHFVFAHHFGIDAAEAALRAEREPIEGDVAGGLIDSPLEFVEPLKVGTLSRD